ncbi:hypothetical protein H2200_005168 [Cladophialophora chaetospira]|uniref:Major facilitator superfamily (MFS) profile domain-containing protein n=1 Tax=Cladophialophora chaetospira TaxID=386627 RepID=A0AA38XC29_9EURO|nr:hypothetical protein H2200_005168 [Cladophialophora chaetospira]
MLRGLARRESRCEVGDANPDPLLSPSSDESSHKNESRSTNTLLLKLYVIVFCINLGFQMLFPAQTQIYESIYCSQWYKDHPDKRLPENGSIPESYCKIPAVQTQISTLKGWFMFFNAAPGLLLSIPMGILTDRIGRRKLILVNLTSVFLVQVWTSFISWFGGQIPLRAIWLGTSLNLLTGGTIVLELLYVCILTDISPSDRVAETFFRTNAFGQLSKVVGPFLAGALMRIDAWLAVYVGLAFMALTVMLAATVPETLHWHKSAREDSIEVQGNQDDQTPTTETRKPHLPALRRLLKIWSDWRLVFVALTYPFRLICDALGDLLQRYMSNRYGWTLANATWVYSIQAIFAGLVLFTLLPFISGQIDRRFDFSIIQKNVILSRAALLMVAIAYTVIGLAPNAVVMMLGLLIETLSTGYPSTLRAIATALVSENDRGSVFSVLSIAETLSTMMAYPITAALFNIGIEKGGGAWLGLPYDIIAVVAVVSLVAMCLVRFERPVRL